MALTLPSSATSSTTNALAADERSLNAMKYEPGQNSAQAAKEAAKQLDSLFLRVLFMSMCENKIKTSMNEGD